MIYELGVGETVKEPTDRTKLAEAIFSQASLIGKVIVDSAHERTKKLAVTDLITIAIVLRLYHDASSKCPPHGYHHNGDIMVYNDDKRMEDLIYKYTQSMRDASAAGVSGVRSMMLQALQFVETDSNIYRILSFNTYLVSIYD